VIESREPAASSFLRLFGLGFRAASREPALWLLGAFSRLAAALLAVGTAALGFALFVHVLDDTILASGSGLSAGEAAMPFAVAAFARRYGPALAGAWVVAFIFSLALDALYVACTVRRAKRHCLEDRALSESSVLEGSGFLGRALFSACLLLPLRATASLYALTALGATSLVYLGAVGERHHGAIASLALGLALVLVLALEVAVGLISALTSVCAVSRDRGPVSAVVEATKIVWRRPGRASGLFAGFAIIGGAIDLGAASFGALFIGARHPMAQAIEIAFALIIPMLAGLAGSAVDIARWSAFTAFELDERGELPPPPAPPVPAVIEAEPVLDTELVLVAEPNPLPLP
jgi:hypothetical protein